MVIIYVILLTLTHLVLQHLTNSQVSRLQVTSFHDVWISVAIHIYNLNIIKNNNNIFIIIQQSNFGPLITMILQCVSIILHDTIVIELII